MVFRVIAVEIAAGALLAVAWYVWFLRYNRRRGTEVLLWIERAFHQHGQIGAVRWRNAACLFVELKLAPAIFRNASLTVHLFPRQIPVAWLLSRIRRQQETLTFRADLDGPPSFNLEVHNHRWYGRTRRRPATKSPEWNLQQAGPFVLTTRNDWQREITTMMSALVASRECDCSCVCFRRTSPHFSVTVPLGTIAPDSQTHGDIFDVLRELAAGASTSRF
jgi:hypothetical protein